MNNRSLTITVIVILSILVVLLTGGFIYMMHNGGNFNFNFDDSSLELKDSYETSVNEVNNIDLTLISTDIQIIESDTENVLVEYYSNQDKNPKIEFYNGTIKVDEKKTDINCVGFCNVRRKIVLHIPTSYTGEYNFVTVSGDIESQVNLNNEVNIVTTSGDAKLLDVNGIDVTSVSGDIMIKDVSGLLSVNTTSGDVSIKSLNITESSNIKTTSGDIRIEDNAVNCYIEFSSVSGDSRINKSDRKSDLELKVKTTSGDISVN